LENGADFTLANLIGETPLIIAVRSGCSDNVAAILAEIDNLEDSAAKKAAINAKDIAKHTAWYYLNGNVDIQRLLEESKAKWVEQRSKPTKKPPVVQVVTGDGGVVKEVSEENSASQARAGSPKAPSSSPQQSSSGALGGGNPPLKPAKKPPVVQVDSGAGGVVKGSF
jgi:hypothetical protein